MEEDDRTVERAPVRAPRPGAAAARGRFATTHWSLVARAATPRAPGARDALEQLCRAYWWPLYAWVRARGVGADEAADLVQGLFADLIEKQRKAHADPRRGRFRSWILAALEFHLSHERERRRALKRGGHVQLVALDPAEAERRWSELPSRAADPRVVFERAWALAVLDRALARVERAHGRADKAATFAALRPLLLGASEERLASVAARLAVSPAALKTTAFRLRRALAEAVRVELAATVADERDVEDELRVLFASLSGGPSPGS